MSTTQIVNICQYLLAVFHNEISVSIFASLLVLTKKNKKKKNTINGKTRVIAEQEAKLTFRAE